MAAYDSVPISFVHAYTTEVHRLVAQKQTKLRGAVRVQSGIKGKTYNFERIGSTDLGAIATRHATTTILDPIHSRRRATLVDRGGAIVLDRNDEVKMLIQPENDYAMNHAESINRFYDDQIIAALGGNSTSVAADDTTANVALGAGQTIAAGGSGLTFDKVNQATRMLNQADVPQEDRYAVISPQGLEDLLATTEATSSDFTNMKAIQTGTIQGTWMGFNWIMSTRLPITTLTRSCFFFQKRAVGLAIGIDGYTSISTRHDLNDATQVYAMVVAGAVRIEEALVIQCDITEV
jgi:hypothetical protein